MTKTQINIVEVLSDEEQPFSGRVETGVVQFGEDWPGVFIRGDNALYMARVVALVASSLPPEAWANKAVLLSLAELLSSCSVGDTGWPPS